MRATVSFGQRRLAIAVPPMQAGEIDTTAMTAQVRHLGRGLAKAVRARQPMPPTLLPDLEAQPLHVQVSTIWRAYACYSCRDLVKENDAALVGRYRAIARRYVELAEAGYHIKSAHGMKERHAKVLLQLWRDQGRTPGTIRSRWSILRTWMLALGRSGVIGPIEQYWPDIPKQDLAVVKGGNLRDKTLSEEQMTELMRASDPTHWYVERLHRDLGMTVEEALTFDRHMATNALAGRLVVRSSSGAGFRTVGASAPEQITLVQEIESFMAERGRKRLMWPDMPLAAALKRHQNRLAYLRRKRPAAPAGAETSDEGNPADLTGDAE